MHKILVVDDQENIRQLYKLRLENFGFEVFQAENGVKALNAVYDTVFDLIIVDAMMPEMDGFQLISELRSQGFLVPVIMITALNHISDKKEAFLSGADDYLTKPFDFDELVLRINVILKRAKISTEQKLVIGDTVLDLNHLTITNEPLNLSISLPKKDFQILFKLLSYPEKTFSKSQLFNEFWGVNNFSSEDAVKVYVSKIRNAISHFPEIDVTTVRGIGYRGVRYEKK